VATPTAYPSMVATRAESPNGVGRKRSATNPVANPSTPPGRPTHQAGHDRQQDHDVRVDTSHPQIQHQGLLDDDEEQGHQADAYEHP